MKRQIKRQRCREFSEREITFYTFVVYFGLEDLGVLRRVRSNIRLFLNPSTIDILSLNLAMFGDDSQESEIIDWIVSDELNPEELMNISELREKVKSVINYCERMQIIEKRNLDILKMRYGISDKENPKTLEEIGEVYGLTRERIRQIEYSTIRRLRVVFRDMDLSAKELL